MSKKLQEKSFYDKTVNVKEYCSAQIKRQNAKSYKKRNKEEYRVCARHISDLSDNSSKMICLGTRNNHERDVFAKELFDKNIGVFSQDLAELSGADYIGDFNKLSEFVPHDWDIIYSNSIDHAIDAKSTFFEWLGVLKPHGIMILGFSFDEEVNSADCNSFTHNSVSDFMCDGHNDQYTFVKEFKAIDYYYWVIQKV